MNSAEIHSLLSPYVAHRLHEAQADLVSRYVDLLLHWNRRVNLTAIREPEQIVTRHFGESFFAASVLFPAGASADSRLVDVGSGAGFPGLAMRIVVPGAVTLIESRQKKAVFLREASRSLGFSDVEVFGDRAERYLPPEGVSDLTVTMRAVERFEESLPVAAAILGRGQSRQGRRDRLALLVGAEQAEQARELTPGISWLPPAQIPRSKQRVLLVGQAKAKG